MDLEDLPSVIDEARLVENAAAQSTVVEACLQRILDHTAPGSLRKPHPEQVRALRRLIFGKGDTLLVARTGFGKSIIFHAFSVLTGKITLQIIPLSKLGDEQLDDIRKLSGSNPCLITFENKRQERDLIAKVKQGIYTHVLLGPEQASSKAFREALKSVELQAQIGLVAIDECHPISSFL
jgi:superfamily II DNA helicase RecQ